MKKNNKIILGVIIVIAIIAAFMLITTNAGSSIEIAGSTSVQPTMEKLVEVYKQSHPNANINVQGGGSSVGIKSAEDGSADIGMCSKDINGTDDAKKLNQYVLGQDGIVIAINKDNSVSDLTTEQLQGIFSGNITNWKELGGKDAEIHVVTREEGSGTLDAFKHIVMNKTDIKSDAVVQSSTEAVKQSVTQDPDAIGFVSFAHMSDDVKAVNINGVSPSNDTIADGSYELQRPFLILTKGEPTGDVKDFIDWVMSDDGSKVLADEKIIKSTA